MFLKIKMGLLILASVSTLNAFAQTAPSGSVTTSAKATATLAATCTIATQNVNFGQVILPVSSQSATSNMNVVCSKNAPYTIALAYGGVYGTSQNISAPYQNYGVYKYIQGGQALYWVCQYRATASDGETATNTSISGSAQCPATNGTQTFSVSYAYGKIIGAAQGDSIGYSIQVPNNPSQVWNTGNYSYTSTGTGSSQSIPVVATLIPAQTTNKYPIADTYLDVVTATVSY
jgi:spore coat protein U-like protein